MTLLNLSGSTSNDTTMEILASSLHLLKSANGYDSRITSVNPALHPLLLTFSCELPSVPLRALALYSARKSMLPLFQLSRLQA